MITREKCFGKELTALDLRILALLAEGMATKEIACTERISGKTADSYRTRILWKTGTINTAHLIAYAFRNKLLQ